jgi:hypothetical protein
VVITHVQLQGTWDPQYFIREHGETLVTLVNCESVKTWKATVGKFLGTFGNPEGWSDIEKLKANFGPLLCLCHTHTILIFGQDWPPHELLSKIFPQLCASFTDNVPCLQMARLNGALNFASHFPHNTIPPDLGKLSLFGQQTLIK